MKLVLTDATESTGVERARDIMTRVNELSRWLLKKKKKQGKKMKERENEISSLVR